LYKRIKRVHTTTGDNMDQKQYQKLVEKHSPKEDAVKNGLLAFLMGGIMGILGQGLIDIYINVFGMTNKDASVFMISTLVIVACFLTCLGFFDKLVSLFRAGLIIPITGFAHATQSAALEYRKEGLVLGIGANIFKLSGTVILYGVVAAYLSGLLRMIIFGG